MKLKAQKLAIGLFTLCATNAALAGNTLVNGVAARAQSLQAFVGVADDPSAIYYNPAGITQVTGTQLDNGLMYVIPDQTYVNSGAGDAETASTQRAGGIDLFITSDHVKPVTMGFGIYAPFARTSDYTKNAATSGLNHFSTITRVDFAPTIAMNITEYASVGIGPVISRVSKRSSILGLYQKGRGTGFTGQGGVLFKLPHKIKLGFSYLGKEHARLTGNGEMTGLSGGFIQYLNFPAVWRAGASWAINDNVMLSAGYDYEQWSYFNEAKQVYDNPTLTAAGTSAVDGKNSSDFRIGIDFKPWEHDEVLAGYTYVEAAIPKKNILPAMPDYDTHYFSLGYSHYINRWRFDIGYEFGYMPNRKVTDNSAGFNGDYKMHVSSILLGFAYNFTNNIAA